MYYSYSVILYPSYKTNSIYGVYKLIKTIDDTKESYETIKYLKNKYPNKEIDMRSIVSKYRNIEMAKEDNPYYKEVTFLDSIQVLEEKIKYDDTIDYVDIAKMILSKQSHSQIALNNLLYFIHEEYLRRTGKSNYNMDFEAWPHGPVEVNLRPYIRHHNKKPIKTLNDNEKSALIIRMQQLDVDKTLLEVVEDVLNKYEDYTFDDLYDEGHKPNNLWNAVYYSDDEDKSMTNSKILEHIL